jgi:hypothetical protein
MCGTVSHPGEPAVNNVNWIGRRRMSGLRTLIAVVAATLLVEGCVNGRPQRDIRSTTAVDGVSIVPLAKADVDSLRAAWSINSAVLLGRSRLSESDSRWVQDYIALRESHLFGCSQLDLVELTLLERNNAISLDGGYMRVQFYHELWRVRSCGIDRRYRVWGDVNTPSVAEDAGERKMTYDPAAVESLGVVSAKVVVDELHQSAADMRQAIGPPAAAVPVFEYTVQTQDGSIVKIRSEYFASKIGDCVRVFQSAQPSYPRMSPASGCGK